MINYILHLNKSCVKADPLGLNNFFNTTAKRLLNRTKSSKEELQYIIKNFDEFQTCFFVSIK